MLSVKDVVAGYGHRVVLEGVSIEVGQDECICLLGENGTGKSTLLKVVIGTVGSSEGSIELGGEDMTRTNPSRRIRAGIAYVPQHSVVFPEMTVLENIRLGVAGVRRSERAERLEQGFAAFPKLRELAHRPAGVLSGGERQMVAIGRALAAGPKLLVFDEPSAGLSPLYVQLMYEVLHTVRDSGISILLAEQNVSAALNFADRAYVLDRGKVAMEGTTKELRADEQFRSGYVSGKAFAPADE